MPTEPQNSSGASQRGWWLSVVIVVLIACVGAAYFFSTSLLPGETKKVSITDLQTLATENSVSTRIPTTDAFSKYQGEESGTKYKYIRESLAQMEADLAKTAATDSLSESLFKKANYYKKLASLGITSMDSPEREQTIVKSYDGLYENMNRIAEAAQKENRNPRYLRRLYAYSVAFIYKNSYDPSLFLSSRFSQDPALQELVEKYPSNKDLAAILYIVGTLQSKSDMVNDNFMTSDRMYLYARLLPYKEVQTDAELKNRIFAEIVDMKDLYPKAAVSQLTSSPVENAVRPAISRALGIGISSRFGGPITAEDAKQAYADAYKIFSENVKSEQDSLWMTKFIMDVNYAAHIFNANGKKVTPELSVVLRDLESIKTRFKDNEQMIRAYKNYLMNVNSPNGSWNVALQDMIAIARQDALFRSFLTEVGLRI